MLRRALLLCLLAGVAGPTAAHATLVFDGHSLDPEVWVAADDGGGAPPRLLARGRRDQYTFAWSPDSRTIATVAGPEVGRKDLVLIDVATGVRGTVSSGYFSGVTFSPAGDQI